MNAQNGERVVDLAFAVLRMSGVERRIRTEGPSEAALEALGEATLEFAAALEGLHRQVGDDGWQAACTRAFAIRDAMAAAKAAQP